MTSGDLSPQKPRHSKLWWEIRITAAGLALLAMVIGGYQLWEIALKPLSARVTIQGESDPSFQSESTAEWLVRRLEFGVYLTETNADLLSLPAGTLEGTLRVKGHHQRREVEDGAVVAVGRLPGAEHRELELSLRPTLLEDGGLRFLLPLRDAEAYCRRSVKTFVVIRDQREAAVRGLTSVGRIPIEERRGEPGSYDLEVPLENLIFVLEGDGLYPVEVQTLDGARSTLTVPGEWFLREGQRSRVLTLERAGEAPPPAPEPEPSPVVAETPPPPPTTGAQESPEVDTALQVRLSALEQGAAGAIGRRQWDRAQAAVEELAELEGPTPRVRRLRGEIQTARANEQAEQQLQSAIDAVAEALRAENWDEAEAAAQRVRALSPNEERLSTWQEIIDEGRAADARAEAERIAKEDAQAAEPPAPSEPGADEEALVRATLARYVESQNTLDWNLFVSVFPSIASSRQQVQRAWDGYRSQRVDLDVQSLRVLGDTAVAQCYRTVSVEPKVGGAQRAEGRYEIALGKSSGAWVIERITPLP